MIPENWVEAPLRELLAALQSGSRPRGGVKGIESGVPSLGGEHLNALGGFNFSKIRFVPEAFAERMNAGQIQPHDALIVKDGATTGKTSYVGEDFPYPRAFVNEHVFICRPLAEINSRYLFWYLFSKEGNERIMENFQGSAQGGINTTFAANVIVPLAPLNEQRRIVEKLDELMGRLAAARAKLERVPRLLSHFRRAVLSAACSGALTRDWREKNGDIQGIFPISNNDESALAETWCLTRLGANLDEIKYGTSQKCTVENQGVAVLRIPNIGERKIDCSNLKYAVLPPRELETLHLQVGDLLMIRSNGSVSLVGKTALVSKSEEGLAYAGYLMRLRCNRNYFEPEFVNIALAAPNVRDQIEVPARSTSGVNNINSKEVGRLILPLPPLAEQLEIVRRVNELFALADSLEARFLKAQAFFGRLPAAILAKAFRGELVPQDQSDESASALLDRLREAPSAAPKGKRKPRARAEKQGSLF